MFSQGYMLKNIENLSEKEFKHIATKFFTDVDRSMINKLWVECSKGNIISRGRVIHFFAQGGYESAKLTQLKERTDGERMAFYTKVGKKLGNTQAGDGYRLMGAGFFQITGRKNVAAFAEAENDKRILEEGCDYIAKHYPIRSAVWFWNKEGLSALCDDPKTTVEDVTRVINGGTNGLHGRETNFRALQRLADTAKAIYHSSSSVPRPVVYNSHSDNHGWEVRPVGDNSVGVGYRARDGTRVGAGVNCNRSASVQVSIPIPCSIM